ncbi:9511_t:CDS:1, partial [Acaulospora colombiana]
MNCPPQNHPTTPKFPSLYNPLVERYRECEQRYPSVTYLENASDIFKFTLYWTLILYTPVFALPAIWGLVVHFIPHRLSRRRQRRRQNASDSTFPLSRMQNRQYAAVSQNSIHRQGAGEHETGRNDVGIHMASSPLSSEPFLLDSPVVPTIKAPSTRAETIKQRSALAQAFS